MLNTKTFENRIVKAKNMDGRCPGKNGSFLFFALGCVLRSPRSYRCRKNLDKLKMSKFAGTQHDRLARARQQYENLLIHHEIAIPQRSTSPVPSSTPVGGMPYNREIPNQLVSSPSSNQALILSLQVAFNKNKAYKSQQNIDIFL